jgi:hypothetical protein
MAHKKLLAGLSMIIASPLAAASLEPPPTPAPAPAPAGGPGTLYCMRVTVTGTIPDPVVCWTRDEWAEQGVDVDKEWAKNGVRIEG